MHDDNSSHPHLKGYAYEEYEVQNPYTTRIFTSQVSLVRFLAKVGRLAEYTEDTEGVCV
jgi:hypothetical protein